MGWSLSFLWVCWLISLSLWQVPTCSAVTCLEKWHCYEWAFCTIYTPSLFLAIHVFPSPNTSLRHTETQPFIHSKSIRHLLSTKPLGISDLVFLPPSNKLEIWWGQHVGLLSNPNIEHLTKVTIWAALPWTHLARAFCVGIAIHSAFPSQTVPVWMTNYIVTLRITNSTCSSLCGMWGVWEERDPHLQGPHETLVIASLWQAMGGNHEACCHLLRNIFGIISFQRQPKREVESINSTARLDIAFFLAPTHGQVVQPLSASVSSYAKWGSQYLRQEAVVKKTRLCRLTAVRCFLPQMAALAPDPGPAQLHNGQGQNECTFGGHLVQKMLFWVLTKSTQSESLF